MKKKYRVKKDAKKVAGIPKKSKKADLRRWSSTFFMMALAGLVWGSVELLNLTKYDYSTTDTSNATNNSVAVSSNAEGGEEEGVINILSLELEQIENLANTIAGRNAIWPGYKGDPKDHVAVQRHFSENFAKFINSGKIQVLEKWKGKSVAFAYAVSNTGVIQFVGKIPGGTLDSTKAYVSIMEGISGKMLVTPAQDESGENIIMLYYIRVKFANR